MKIAPPSYALKFLRWFCREDYLEEIEGDLVELFEQRSSQTPVRAKLTFFWWVLRYFRPEFFKSFQRKQFIISPAMFKHNLLITLRGFQRNKTSFLINLIGLSTGISCVLLIYLWVNDEVQVDKFHEKDNRLYQVFVNYPLPNGIQTWDYSPGPTAKAMMEEFPEIEAATTSSNNFFRPKGIISNGETYIPANGLFAATNYFEILSYPLIAGTPSQILEDKQGIAISEKMALTLFNTVDNALGKPIRWNNQFFDTTFQVSGVFANIPANSTEQFDVVIQYQWLIDGDRYAYEWSGGYGITYLVLKEGTRIDEFNEKTSGFLASQGQGWQKATQFLKKYSDKYLYGTYEEGVLVGGRIDYVRLFSIIGLFILLIACINFMNLSTAQASRKMKEIGVKKVIGASRSNLISQFLSESMLIVILSMVLALVLTYLFLPGFNDITGKAITMTWNTEVLASIVMITLITGLIAGSYPAFYLSRFSPLSVLKGRLNSSTGEVWVRKGLVVFQFTLSMIFIVGVIIINQQMAYTQNRNLGYSRDHVVSFTRPSENNDLQVFLDRIRNISGVEKASSTVLYFLDGLDSQAGYSWTGDKAENNHLFQSPMVGYDLIETLGMEVVAGRSFSREFNDDEKKIILNEAAVRMMGLENPVGMRIQKGPEEREIIGVVKDFQYGSIHRKVEPLIFRYRDFGRSMMVKIRGGSEKETLEQMSEVFSEFHPHYPFNFTFMDQDYQKLYEAESRVAILSKYFSALAIIISCLGLLGLAAFTSERRTKEIGIRKILGASRINIVRLLTADFTKMVLMAILFAIPLSYYISSRWLESFAYKIELSWWLFAGAAILTLLIAWITVGFQTLKAASINPAECLRDE